MKVPNQIKANEIKWPMTEEYSFRIFMNTLEKVVIEKCWNMHLHKYRLFMNWISKPTKIDPGWKVWGVHYNVKVHEISVWSWRQFG